MKQKFINMSQNLNIIIAYITKIISFLRKTNTDFIIKVKIICVQNYFEQFQNAFP